MSAYREFLFLLLRYPYYNAERRHSALGYRAPNHYETHLQTTPPFCPA